MVQTMRLARLAAIALIAFFSAGAPAARDGEDGLGGRMTLIHGGVERHYLLRLPPGLDRRGERVPLVLVLHGGGGNGANAEGMTGFTEKARREGFIVAYPEGTGRFGDKLLTWNAGHCCGFAMSRGVDDVGFIDALVARLIADYPIDPRRVYVTGMSNGGMMTHRLGIELSSRFAAIAPVVASLFGDEGNPARPVSALMVNGMLDKSVPPQGGPSGGRFANAWDGTPTLPATAQGTFWARADGCSATPQQGDQPAFLRSRYDCPGGRSVELYLVKDNGHAWPGGQPGSSRGDMPNANFPATDVIWSFFESHGR